MQVTRVWVNGEDAGRYAVSGYDSFSFDITRFVKPGTNLLAVKVDNLTNVDVPPDGQKTDYIQFGGLYRDVFLVVTGPLHVPFAWEGAKAGVRVTAPKVSASRPPWMSRRRCGTMVRRGRSARSSWRYAACSMDSSMACGSSTGTNQPAG